MNAAEIFAVAASSVAIVTSVGSLAVAGFVAFRDRAHLTVSSAIGIAAITATPETLAMITVVNDGRLSEIVSFVGFRGARGRLLYLASPKNYPGGLPPQSLTVGDSLTAWISPGDLKKGWADAAPDTIKWVFADTKRGKQYRAKIRRDILARIREA